MLSFLSCGGGLGLCFFPRTVWGKFTCGTWLPESWLHLEFISAIPAPGHVLRTAGIIRPQRLRNRGASKRRRCSCSYRKCPQGGSTFPWPPLAPWTTRALGNLASWAVNWSGMCLSNSLKEWISLLTPKASPLPSRLIPTKATVPCWGA